jgi:CSLREA domain-containing protein
LSGKVLDEIRVAISSILNERRRIMLGKRVNKWITSGCIIVLVLALWPPLASPVEAAVYTVDTVVDENDGSCGDGDCSLRDAIILANTPGPDSIQFNISGCG